MITTAGGEVWAFSPNDADNWNGKDIYVIPKAFSVFTGDHHGTNFVKLGSANCDAILKYLPGTGGTVTVGLLRNSSSGASCIAKEQGSDQDGVTRLPSVNEMMANIRSAFHLTIVDTALALRVERPTVYSWLRGDVMPSISNSERIRVVYELARLWLLEAEGKPFPEFKVKVFDGKSLFDLLCDERPRSFVIERMIRTAGADARNSEQGEKLSIRERAKRRDIQDSVDSADAIEIVTGRRLSAE